MPLPRVRLRALPALFTTFLIVLLIASLLPPGISTPAHAVEGMSISGRVSLATTATPASTGEVVVEYRQPGAEPDPDNVVPVAADGTYRIEGLPDGTSWFVFFRYRGTDTFASQWWKEEPATLYPIQSVNLQGTDRNDVDQTLQRKGFIEGVVSLGDAATPAPAGSVAVSYRVHQGESRWSPWSDGVPVDANGHYVIPDMLPSTSVHLAFTYSGDGPFQSVYWPSVHYEHQTSSVLVGSPWKPGGTLANVTLPGKVELSGRVFLDSTATAAPADSVRVSLEYGARTWSDATWTWHPVADASVLVDADGRYQFSGLDSANYRVAVEYVAGTQYSPRTTVEVTAGLTAVQDITIAPAYTLSGRVYLGSTDRPAGEGEVLVTAKRVFPSDWAAYGPVQTAADGSYTITGLPGAYYEIKLHYTGAEDFPDLIWADDQCVDMWCHTVVGPDRLDYDMVMKPGRGLYGVVRDSAGAPLEGMTVSVRHFNSSYNEWFDGGETSTAADGSYRFNSIADAEWVVSFSDPAGNYTAHAWPGISEYYEPWTVDLRDGRDSGSVDATMLRPASIEGKVTGVGFAPAPADLEVEVFVYDDGSASWIGTGDVVPVDSSGHYRITGLYPDWYRLVAWWDGSRGHGRGASGVLTLDEDEQASADLKVERLGLAPARDFSEDGIPDVLVRSADGGLLRYAGSGQGGWRSTALIGVGWNVMTSVFSAGDFTGDGNNDVLARDGAGDLWLYPRDGLGGWKAPSRIGWGWSSFSELFSPGDFDGDGAPDVMARDSAGGLWLYRGNGAGGWAGAVKVGSGWGMFNRIFAPGDFDGDGHDDVMGRDAAGTLWLYPGDGAGGWRTPSIVGSGWNMFSAIFGAGDFDGDGGPDVIGRDGAGNLLLYPGDGAGGWLSGVAVIGTGWNGLRFVD